LNPGNALAQRALQALSEAARDGIRTGHRRQGGWRRRNGFLWGLLAGAAAVGCGGWLWCQHLRRADGHTVQTTVYRHVENRVTYVTTLPAALANAAQTLQVPAGASEQALVATVDRSGLPVSATARIVEAGNGTLRGAVTRQPDGRFDFTLLDPTTTPAASTGTTQPLAALLPDPLVLQPAQVAVYQVNAVRTALAYYETEHGGPPPALGDLQSLLPPAVALTGLTFTPGVADVAKAVQPASGWAIPYQPVTVVVQPNAHRLQVKVGESVLLQAAAGVGTTASPTPLGTFVVTDRLVNQGPAVYGPYIFPLNHSAYALHGTDQAGKVGASLSLGCVNVSNSVDAALYALLPVGARVVITNQPSGQPEPVSAFRA
ncbi:MAG: L,D-transpeptidase, partial [Alicyclobacillus sp.]|nr:L,D-transpeptidase [Alicyclobacillus sp.]